MVGSIPCGDPIRIPEGIPLGIVKPTHESKGAVAKLLNLQDRIITNHIDK